MLNQKDKSLTLNTANRQIKEMKESLERKMLLTNFAGDIGQPTGQPSDNKINKVEISEVKEKSGVAPTGIEPVSKV